MMIDDVILDKIAQPAAERLESLGISHFSVASFCMQTAAVSSAIGFVWRTVGHVFDGNDALTGLIESIMLTLLINWARQIHRDKKRAESGNTSIPISRAENRSVRVMWALIAASDVPLWFLGDRHPSSSAGVVVSLSITIGLYLWATIPKPPSSNFRSSLVPEGSGA